ncbi:MAG: MFS transporter [Actinomycetota bacterium]|nr:MFS transporter [Actinomycetota bacterium]
MRAPQRSLQILIAVALPLVVLSIDFSGVAVALPDIGDDLNASSGQVGWVLNAFALGAAGPLLVSGRIADRYGRRRLLLAGVGLFSVGTLLCAVAWTFEVLVLSRVVQGVATSLFMPASLSVVSTGAGPERRAWAIGMWSAIGSTAAAAAPVVGGLVVDALGWRWFFALNVPLLIVAAAMIVAVVPESRGDDRRIDLLGAAIVTTAVTAVVYGLQEAGLRGWTDPLVIGALVAGALLFVVFVIEQRGDGKALIDAAISRSAAYRPPVAVAFLANWGFGALNILLTFWLQDVRGESAAMTGVIFLAYSVPFAVLGAVTGRVARRYGTALPMAVGMVLVAGSFLVLTQLGATAPIAVVLVAMLLSGVGQGLSYNMSTTAAMAAVPDEDAGVASGLLTAVRNVGVAAGVALATLATSGGAPGDGGAAFTDGLRHASWVIVLVSMVGVGVAVAARRPAAGVTDAMHGSGRAEGPGTPFSGVT